MEQTKKKISFLKRIKWMCLLFGFIMYISTESVFGLGWATALTVASMAGFYLICDGEARRTICQYVADDIKDAVASAGHKKCIVEIKSLRGGLITRVYLIGAGARAGICSKAVISRIKRSWYKSSVWVTQLIDLDDESQLETAQEMFNEELLSDLKKMKNHQREETFTAEKEEELRQWVREVMRNEEGQTEQSDPVSGEQSVEKGVEPSPPPETEKRKSGAEEEGKKKPAEK